jgi:mitochondrial fission protein ELM1
MNAPLVIWQLADGKPGHENQSLGLIEALGRRIPIASHKIDIAGSKGMIARVKSAMEHAASLPRPEMIIAAGHATHLSLLALTRRYDSRSVVMMKPSLPAGLFDLCIVPKHDVAGSSIDENMIVTTGALNRVHANPSVSKSGGLLLIGGPSSTHGWNADEMMASLVNVVKASPNTRWTLTDSRRTPTEMVHHIREALPNITIFPHQETTRGWLPDQLIRAEEIWVSEDSVSMVYEALSSGARVGLLPVPRKKSGRVAHGIDRLVADGLVMSYAQWLQSGSLPETVSPLAEADRCAGIILKKWFPHES